MIIRDSTIGRVLFAFTACTWLIFAVLCARFGDKVTSKQWTYLMSIPGHKWFWVIAFGVSSIAALVGIIRRWHAITAAGLFFLGTLDLLIFAFYLLAPLIDTGLMTLGYVVWFFASALTYAFAAINVTPVKWF